MEKLQVTMILEILGRPAEHVKESLKIIVDKLGSEKGVKLLESKFHDVIPVKDSKDLFTTFVEVTVEMDSLYNFFGIIFAYMPSHIEIIAPERPNVTNADFNELGNRLLQRLHDYDGVTKNMIMERDLVVNKLKEIAPHLFEKKPEQEKKQSLESQVQSEEPKKAKKAKAKKVKSN